MEETKPAVKAPLDQLAEVVTQIYTDADQDTLDGEEVGIHMRGYLQGMSRRLAAIHQLLEDAYIQVWPVDNQPWSEQVPTTAQGVALARFMRSHFDDPSHASAFVSRGTQGLGPDYLHCRFNDGMEGGIDKQGRVST